MLAVSFACDLGFLAFTRWLLRRVSKTTGLPQIVGLAFLNCIIALSIVAIPFELAVVFSDRNGLTLLALASAAVIPLNVIDLIACGIVFRDISFVYFPSSAMAYIREAPLCDCKIWPHQAKGPFMGGRTNTVSRPGQFQVYFHLGC